ncbi:flotillin domain-containing protein [Xylona heveae TC161]|uniref:Flotillin domain-containing protein n=1 Tax=Xylona heveae (strain CBS 132557 / TC161) TaxID=1328760 RepID=A0A165A705_XYLHT|nr:flotillin domain-containing protein [Xylona heveae TC161]KZF20044.1 flotillin domain-containing protein [Xylona heveae TC161]
MSDVSRYHIADPSDYLIITGAGIEDVRVVKKVFVYPWQRVTRIKITPFDFSLSLQAMTIEKLQFSLPAVFTIGPDDNQESLRKYAKILSGAGKISFRRRATAVAGGAHVQDTVKGIIEGETRVIISGMSMEEVFRERQVFKQKVIENVQSELNQFGLRIYNANVKELQDTPGSEYFAFLSRKAHEGASNQARIDVAEASMRGRIGEAEKEGRAKQEISKIDAETAVLETQRKSEKASADAQLTNKQTELNMGINLARIKAQRQAEATDAELQREVEQKRAEMELERLRATDVTKSKIEKESAQQKADADYYTLVKNSDSSMYKEKTKEAEALFFSRQKEAQGLSEMAKAYSLLMQYLMLQNNVYEKLANANAAAIQGLQPKITIWNTDSSGSGTASNTDSAAAIRNLYQSLPPLFSTINEQTGLAPPTWLAQYQPSQQYQYQQGADDIDLRRSDGSLTASSKKPVVNGE